MSWGELERVGIPLDSSIRPSGFEPVNPMVQHDDEALFVIGPAALFRLSGDLLAAWHRFGTSTEPSSQVTPKSLLALAELRRAGLIAPASPPRSPNGKVSVPRLPSRMLDPVRDRFLTEVSSTPESRTLWSHADDVGDTFIAAWDPLTRRVLIATGLTNRSDLDDGCREVLKAVDNRSLLPTKVLIMAERPRAQEAVRTALKRLPKVQLVFRHDQTGGHSRIGAADAVTIRELTTSDEPAARDYVDEYESVSRLFDFHVLKRPSDQVSAIGAFTSDGVLVGTCFAHRAPPIPEVIYIHVIPERRGHAIASTLLSSAGSWAGKGGQDLYCSTAATNQAAFLACVRAGYTLAASKESTNVPYDAFRSAYA